MAYLALVSSDTGVISNERADARGLHGPEVSVRARPGAHGCNLGPARKKN